MTLGEKFCAASLISNSNLPICFTNLISNSFSSKSKDTSKFGFMPAFSKIRDALA